MDTAALVREQVDEGEGLLRSLRLSGFDIDVAFWALPAEDREWIFFIASKEANGLIGDAYRKLYKHWPPSELGWFSRSDVKLISTTSPISRDAKFLQSKRVRTHLRRGELGLMPVDAAVIYPEELPSDSPHLI